MPPTPKPPGQRVRRNKDQPQWRSLSASGRNGRAPACPTKWLAATKTWWKTIWASPMALAWVDADVPALLRLGSMIDLINRSTKPSSLMLGEIRQLEDRFGLSPKSRRMLQWEITAGEEEQESERPLADVRRLRAVDAKAS